jgi:hypothetical protein
MNGFRMRGHLAWVANMNPTVDALRASCAALIRTYYEEPTRELGYKRWGFKEVRHSFSCAGFFLECFPQGRVLLLVRNLADVLASNAANDWYQSVGGARGIYELWYRNVDSFARCSDERAMVVHYEQIVATPTSTLEQICAHIGIRSVPDLTLMSHYVRATETRPRLGVEELAILEQHSGTQMGDYLVF